MKQYNNDEMPKMNQPSGYQEIHDSVFIIGCERSGTTFLGSLIGAHSKCVVTPEAQFVTDIYQKTRINKFVPKDIFSKIKNTKRFKGWGVDIAFTESEYMHMNNYSDLILMMVEKYNIHKRHKKSARIWVDHTPINIEHVDLLKRFFPNARFLHIIRDGRGVASSLKKVTWGPKTMRSISRFWIKKLAYGYASAAKYPQDILSVKYEDILLDTETSIKKMTDFLGMEYEKEMLDANGLIVPKNKKYQHKLVGKKADQSRVRMWEKNLSKREIEIFEYETNHMLTLLGYEMLFSRPRKARYHERLLSYLGARRVKLVNKLGKILRKRDFFN